jgi:phosphoserine phosphatase
MNLVLQGPTLTRTDVDAVADGVRPVAIEKLSEKAFRLKGATRHDSVAKLCEARRIDCAWMPEGRRFTDLKLLAMDMDSTLITIECIDELGAYAGKKAEIAAITEAAMRGEIADYKESLRQRVALLAGQPESILEDLYTKKLALTPGAEQLIAACRKHGIKLLLVSGGFSYITARLKARLGLDYVLSNTLAVDGGQLTGHLVGDIVDAQAKADRFVSLAKELKAKKEQTVAIGDGANDLKMMAEAGTSVAFHAKPVVRAQATCSLTYSGLDGVLNLFE